MKRAGSAHITLGLDEAGRGPILGPMVMAVVALRPAASTALKRAGVTDSKRFGGPKAHSARAALVPLILHHADHVGVRIVDVEAIDAAVAVRGLNRLEQTVGVELIAHAPAARRIVCDGARLFSPLIERYPHLEAHDRGEDVHVAVAAASIIAKVRRDETFARAWHRYAELLGHDPQAPRGGGYLNPATRSFLRGIIGHTRSIPPEGRRSWPWDFAADLLR